MNKWTKKWPTKPGRYWFYGWPYGNTHTVISNVPVEPELNPVMVWENGSVVRDGSFWYKKDGWIGMFCKTDVPELPDVSGMVPKIKEKK